MDVSIELTRLLGNDGIPLRKRIHLAKNSFVSYNLPVVAKEQVVESKEEVSLKWLCALVEKKTEHEEALISLRECLTSKRIKYYKFLYISPCTRNSLISTLSALENANAGENLLQVECCLSLFEISLFQQHFSRSPSDYSLVVGSLLRCLRNVESDCFKDLCWKVSSSFSFYTKTFYLDRSYQKYFFMNVLSALSLLVEAEGLRSEYQESFKEYKKCTHLTLFPQMDKEKHHEAIDRLFLSLIQGSEKLATVDVCFIEHLHSASTTVESNEFLCISSVLFQAYMSSCPRDSKQHCEVFLIICYLLGFKPVVRDKCPSFSGDADSFFSLSVISFPKKSLPYRTLKVLIGALNEGNVNLNVEVGGHLLISWLKGICECLVLREDTVDDLALSVLTALSDLDPSILDAHTIKVLGPTMLKRPLKKGAITKRKALLYICFLKSLLNSSIKLHRTQKLASRILSSVKEELSLDHSLANKVTVEDILPKIFCTDFGGSMQLLVVSQALAMLRTLMFHLSEDCVAPMEHGQCDPSVVLLLQATKCLLCAFLVGYKAIDPNIPEAQAEKFTLLMAELGSTLGRLGRALLLEKHNPDTIGAFLELSHCWGDLQLLLVFYRLDKQLDDSSSVTDFVQLPPATSNKLCGNSSRNSVGSTTDFSFLHSYLMEGEWSHLVERIVNFGDEHCKEILDELVIQKVKMLMLFEPSIISDKACFCVQHLLSRACDSDRALALLVENEAIITPVLDEENVNQLLELIVGKTAFGQETLLKAFHDNPVVAPVAAVSLLKQIGENALIIEDKGKVSRKRRHCDREEDLDLSQLGPSSKRQKGPYIAHTILQLVAKTPLKMTDLSSSGAFLSGEIGHSRGDSVLKLLEAIAATLSEYLTTDCKMTKALSPGKSVIDFSALKNLIHLLNSLPLAHLGSDLRIIVNLCVIGLLIASREHHQPCNELIQAEISLSKVLLLSMKAFDMTKELVSYLNIGDFLVWYISEKGNCVLVEHKSESVEELVILQVQMMEGMVEVAMSSSTGLKQLKSVVKGIKARLKEEGTHINTVYRLSSILMAAFAKKCGKSSSAALKVKQKCHKYYSSIAVSIINGVNFHPTNVTKEMLECFYLILQIIIPMKDQRRLSKVSTYLGDLIGMVKQRLVESDVDVIQPNPMSVLEGASSRSEGYNSYCINFMEKLLCYRMHFKKSLPSMFAWDVWQLFLSTNSSVDRKTFLKAIKTLLLSANKMEFVLLTNDLLEKLANLDLASPDHIKFHHYMLFWRSLVQVSLNKGLADVRQATIKAATPIFLSFIKNWDSLRESVPESSLTEVAIDLLEFEHILLRSQKVNLHYHTIDLVFESISAVLQFAVSDVVTSPAKTLMNPSTVKQDLAVFQRVFLSCTNTLLALVTHQPENLMDRISSFLQQLSQLFLAVVVHGNVEYNPAGGLQGGTLSQNLLIVTDCAMSLEWICNALVKFKKEFVRISPYFIADLVCGFEKNPVHPSVKVHLHNCIYVFIYFCDPSGLTYVQHALSAGPREIFRSILENYKKFYRFKGKI